MLRRANRLLLDFECDSCREDVNYAYKVIESPRAFFHVKHTGQARILEVGEARLRTNNIYILQTQLYTNEQNIDQAPSKQQGRKSMIDIQENRVVYHRRTEMLVHLKKLLAGRIK